MSTAALVAASRRAGRRLAQHLREAGAVDARYAVPIPDQGLVGRQMVRRLTAAGAIREAGGGYYLDDAAYTAYCSRRARTMAMILVPLVIGATLIIWWASTR